MCKHGLKVLGASTWTWRSSLLWVAGGLLSARCPEDTLLHPQKTCCNLTNGPSVQTVQTRGEDARPLLIWSGPVSFSCGRRSPRKPPAPLCVGTRSLNAAWTQGKGAEKEPFGERHTSPIATSAAQLQGTVSHQTSLFHLHRKIRFSFCKV